MSDQRKSKKCVSAICICLREDDIMAGTIFQIGRRDFSFPGGLGRLLKGRSLAAEITCLHCWTWPTTLPVQTGGTQRGVRFPSGSSQPHLWKNGTTGTPLTGQGNIGGSCLLPEMKNQMDQGIYPRLLFLVQGPNRRKKLC